MVELCTLMNHRIKDTFFTVCYINFVNVINDLKRFIEHYNIMTHPICFQTTQNDYLFSKYKSRFNNLSV